MVPCKGCGKDLHISATSCPHCGAKTGRGGGGKNKVVAAILAFFLGGFGVHRFYLGQWWGIAYLLLCWTMIPGVIALIEAIVFLVTGQQKWDDRYNDGVPSGGSGGGAVVAVILGIFAVMVFVAVIGILAAIAIPAYQDYTVRAKAQQAYVEAQAMVTELDSHIEQNGSLPSTTDAPLLSEQANHTVEWTGEQLLITMKNAPNGNGSQFALEPIETNSGVQWVCSNVDLREKYLPRECRE